MNFFGFNQLAHISVSFSSSVVSLLGLFGFILIKGREVCILSNIIFFHRFSNLLWGLILNFFNFSSLNLFNFLPTFWYFFAGCNSELVVLELLLFTLCLHRASECQTLTWRLLVHKYARRLRLLTLFKLRTFPHRRSWLTFMGRLNRISGKSSSASRIILFYQGNLIGKVLSFTLLRLFLLFLAHGLLALLSKLRGVQHHLRLEADNAHLSHSFHVVWLWVLLDLFRLFDVLFLNIIVIVNIIFCFT